MTRHLCEMDADPDPQVEYRRLGLLGGLGAMGPRQFRQVVSFLAHHPRYATTEVLVAPGCFPLLVELLSDEDLAISAEAARLLQPDEAGREALQAALGNPRVVAHAQDLRKRWPELLPPP